MVRFGTGGRRYAPFTVNIEKKKPFHTLTGRMHFFLDHDWMHEMGEATPIYRPPLDMTGSSKNPRLVLPTVFRLRCAT